MTAVCRLRRPGLRAHILHALRLLFARKPEEEAVRQTANAQAARMLDAYGNSILRLAYSYLHNQSDAEEVLQDTLLQFLRTAPVLESPQHEKAWLLRVAANLSKNRLKYNRLRSADELRDTLEHLEKLLDREESRLRVSFEAAKEAGYRKYIMFLQ